MENLSRYINEDKKQNNTLAFFVFSSHIDHYVNMKSEL